MAPRIYNSCGAFLPGSLCYMTIRLFNTRFVPPLLLLPMFLSGCGGGHIARRGSPDIYPDYAALSAANVEGRDYSREIYDRKSPVSILAIHGGDLELSTSRLARAVAGSDFNLYLFNSWLGGDSVKLHVTSLHFDDPAAVAISTSALFAVSIHAQADRGEWVCVGGSSAQAAREVALGLLSAGFKAEAPCGRLPGTNPRNIVNRSAKGGIQLELTLKLLERLENYPADRIKFANSVRGSLFAVLKNFKSGQNYPPVSDN
jgi:phage replication-related protein YjqB (UPF0714/DUF867 family)